MLAGIAFPQWVPEGSSFFITIKCLPPGKNQLCQAGIGDGVLAAMGRPYDSAGYRAAIDWALVDRLIPMGGIRVEDNIFVGKDANRNLTRESLPE